MTDATVELSGLQCDVKRGILGWRVQHKVELVRWEFPTIVGSTAYGAVYAQVPGGVFARAVPVPAWTAVESDGDPLNRQGRRRMFQVAAGLFNDWHPTFQPIYFAGLCLAGSALDGSESLFWVTAYMTPQDSNLPDLLHVSINGGPYKWMLELNVEGVGGYYDRRFQIAVDFGAVAPDGRWGAYWVGFTSNYIKYFPEFPDMGFTSNKLEWLKDGEAGGDPIEGFPLGYLFESGYVPPVPISIQIGMDANTYNWEGGYAQLYPNRDGFTYDLGLDDNVSHLPRGFMPWDEEAPDEIVIRPRGLNAPVYTGQFPNLIPALLVGLQTDTHQGDMTRGVGFTLQGLQATVQRGLLGPGIAVVPTGRQMTVFSNPPVPGQGVSLIGQQATMAQGLMRRGLSVKLTGRQATMARGMFPGLSVSVPLTGQETTAAGGELQPGVRVQLEGQMAPAVIGTLSPALGLRLVGRQLTVQQGHFVPQLSALLSGLEAVAQGGALTVALAVRPTGLQAVVEQGGPGYLYDCNVYLNGIELRAGVGVEPLLTNVPDPEPDTSLWVRQDDDDIFVQIEPP